MESLKITAEMLPILRKCRGLSQSEFAEFAGLKQSKLSDIECGKVPVNDHYKAKLFLALGKLKFSEQELNNIYELTEMNK